MSPVPWQFPSLIVSKAAFCCPTPQELPAHCPEHSGAQSRIKTCQNCSNRNIKSEPEPPKIWFSKLLSAEVVSHALVGAPWLIYFALRGLGTDMYRSEWQLNVCVCIYIYKNTHIYEKRIKNQTCTFHSKSGATKSVNGWCCNLRGT